MESRVDPFKSLAQELRSAPRVRALPHAPQVGRLLGALRGWPGPAALDSPMEKSSVAIERTFAPNHSPT